MVLCRENFSGPKSYLKSFATRLILLHRFPPKSTLRTPEDLKPNNQIVTLNHQTTNLVFTNFFHETSQLSSWKRKLTFRWSKTEKKKCFGPIKSLLSFSTAQTTKNSWKKLGETKFVVWLIDVTNKMQRKLEIISGENFSGLESNLNRFCD